MYCLQPAGRPGGVLRVSVTRTASSVGGWDTEAAVSHVGPNRYPTGDGTWALGIISVKTYDNAELVLISQAQGDKRI